ncbi:MAG TPA: hypothetical protein VF071_08315 [Candidatus Limnocylindria bacterium]
MLTRRPSIGRIDWLALPLHPLGMAAFPGAFLFAGNAVLTYNLVEYRRG